SSATSLMVVSFVNANLLTLTEAIGVIMGANIGTTVTAWLISIFGFKVSMSAIALPLVGLGFLLTLSKKQDRQHWGYFTIGFAVLFIGLQFLKDSVPDIGNNPEVLATLSEYTSGGFLSLILFIAFGTVLTLIVQSSSATMALTLLMTYEGWIPFDMAAAMVIGQNVGTTITANLAALVANYQAKRAARAHLIFNLLGLLILTPFLYPMLNYIDGITQNLEGASPFVEAAAIPIALSLFHTFFNIINTLLLIGFIKQIAKIVEWMVPAVIEEEAEIDQPRFLSPSSLVYPQTGIKALFDESLRLLQDAAYKAITHGLSVHREDLESDVKLKSMLESKETIPVDIERIYATKIKSVYSKILEYATILQSKFALEKNKIETIRNILIADRMLVLVVKRMVPLHKNIVRALSSNNHALLQEYNQIRRKILKVIRQIHRASLSDQPVKYIEKIEKQKAKAEELDVLLSGHVNKLVLDGAITNDMATSLMNDSEEAQHIVRDLVDIATLLYYPRDELIDQIEEQELELRATS
ncbi:MAG: Na/Pi symporter, partial [Gammaproteobacteria bacterium]